MSTINKINVGGTEYEIGGGSKLYRHKLSLNIKVAGDGINVNAEPASEFAPSDIDLQINIINASPNKITALDIRNYFSNYEFKQYAITKFGSYLINSTVNSNAMLFFPYYGPLTPQIQFMNINSGTSYDFTVNYDNLETFVNAITYRDYEDIDNVVELGSIDIYL